MDVFHVRSGQDVLPALWSHCQNPANMLYYGLAFVFCACYLAHYLDLQLLFIVPDSLWDLIVFVTPSSFILAVEGASSLSNQSSTSYTQLRTFDAKRETMSEFAGRRTAQRKGLQEPAGLQNRGVQCYQNGLLQGIASLSSVSEFLQYVRVILPGYANRNINNALYDLFFALNSQSNCGQTLRTPPRLARLKAYQQQDAQEYYTKIIEAMQDEIVRDLAADNMPNPFGVDGRGVTRPRTTGTGALIQSSATQNQPDEEVGVRNPVEMLLASHECCTRCGYSPGLKLNEFTSLTLHLDRGGPTSIESLLNNRTQIETLEEVRCPQCTLEHRKGELERLINQSTANAGDSSTTIAQRSDSANAQELLKNINAALEQQNYSEKYVEEVTGIDEQQWIAADKTRQSVFARCPGALVLHIHRSYWNDTTLRPNKNSEPVTFPQYLNLCTWSLGGLIEAGVERWDGPPGESILAHNDSANGGAITDDTPLYGLRAVTSHSGKANGGHYVTYRQTPYSEMGSDEQDRRWWCYNDAHVRESRLDLILNDSRSYLLFYEALADDERAEYIASLKPVPRPISAKLQTPMKRRPLSEVQGNGSPFHSSSSTTSGLVPKRTTSLIATSVSPRKLAKKRPQKTSHSKSKSAGSSPLKVEECSQSSLSSIITETSQLTNPIHSPVPPEEAARWSPGREEPVNPFSTYQSSTNSQPSTSHLKSPAEMLREHRKSQTQSSKQPKRTSRSPTGSKRSHSEQEAGEAKAEAEDRDPSTPTAEHHSTSESSKRSKTSNDSSILSSREGAPSPSPHAEAALVEWSASPPSHLAAPGSAAGGAATHGTRQEKASAKEGSAANEKMEITREFTKGKEPERRERGASVPQEARVAPSTPPVIPARCASLSSPAPGRRVGRKRTSSPRLGLGFDKGEGKGKEKE